MIIGELIAPLSQALRSPAYMQALLRDLGSPVELTDEQAALVTDKLALGPAVDAILTFLEQTGDGPLDAGKLAALSPLVESLYDSIEMLGSMNAASLAQLPSLLDNPQTWRQLAADLPEYLFVSWLELYSPFLYELLSFVGIITLTERAAGLPAKRAIAWDAVGGVINSPVDAIKSRFKWGTADFDYEALLTGILQIANAADFFAVSRPVSAGLGAIYFDPLPAESVFEVEVPLYNGRVAGTPVYFDFSLIVLPAPQRPSDTPITGIAITNALHGEAAANNDLGDGWQLRVTTTGTLDGAIGAMIQPEGVSLTGAAASSDASATLSANLEPPMVLLGSPDRARLEVTGLEAQLLVRGPASQPELVFAMRTTGVQGGGLKLVIAPANGDSFISEILGAGELAITSALGFAWSSEAGFRFDGGAGFEVVIPLNVKAGPVQVDLLRLALEGGTGGAQVEAAVSGAIDINVLAVVVDGIGIRAKVTPLPQGDHSGSLGPLDLKFEFKPPNGLGLVIDGAGIVTGGGYLEHDEDKVQYAGIAEIGFVNLDLSAIGVLTTRMPDGSDGWSLFLSVFSEFPPIQVGFGFTLNGVGGLIGINRTLDDDALRERLLQGTLDSIMFPEDPVINAPIIINDIEAVFPPARDQFIFGAMLKFGWGTPSLVTADLGVMIELPDPIRIALMGQLEAILPTADVRILELRMDVFGLVDLTARTFALDAVIRDSHIVELLSLSGDMAMRADLLDQPTLLLSVGGFSPRFKAPAGFPKLRLMRASVPVGSLASVDLSCYVAFTSNTFQMGGRVDVWAKFAGFTAEGFVEMDALIQFVPFGFQFHTGFGVTVRAGRVTLMGVEVSADLAGPSPWEVFGTATFEILKLKKNIHLEISVGKEKKNIAEKYDVSLLLETALSDSASWSVPEEGELLTSVRLRDRETDEERAVLPSGRVQVTQKIVPLNAEIETFGGGQVTGINQFSIDKILVGNEARVPAASEYIEEWFAPAQFFKMKDKEKIAAPSFELMASGVRFGADEVAAGSTAELDVEYEEIVLDPKLKQQRRAKVARAALGAKQLTKVEKYGAAAKIRAEDQRFRKIEVEPTYKISEQKFVATNLKTGNPAEGLTGIRGRTYAEAASLVRKQNRASLSSLEQFDVVRREELALPAS